MEHGLENLVTTHWQILCQYQDFELSVHVADYGLQRLHLVACLGELQWDVFLVKNRREEGSAVGLPEIEHEVP